MDYERISKFNDKKFERSVGIPRILFEILVEIVKDYLIQIHKKGGRKPNLSLEKLLLMLFIYYRNYPTFLSLSIQFGLDESNEYKLVKKIEKLIFGLLSINQYVNNIEFSQLINISCFDAEQEIVRNADVTECSVQRSKIIEVQEEYYSGKKKKHTKKIQIIIEEFSNKILSIAFEKGSAHDFEVFKNTIEEMDKDTPFFSR